MKQLSRGNLRRISQKRLCGQGWKETTKEGMVPVWGVITNPLSPLNTQTWGGKGMGAVLRNWRECLTAETRSPHLNLTVVIEGRNTFTLSLPVNCLPVPHIDPPQPEDWGAERPLMGSVRLEAFWKAEEDIRTNLSGWIEEGNEREHNSLVS